MGIWRAGTSFRALFRERECRTLVRPAVDEDSLLHLASLAPDQLRPEFVSQMASIREDLLSRVGPKQLYGQDMDGPMLGALVESRLTPLIAPYGAKRCGSVTLRSADPNGSRRSHAPTSLLR